MPNALTREDLQEDFKQLLLEIHQIGKIVQENVRQELHTFLGEYSTYRLSSHGPALKKKSQNLLLVPPNPPAGADTANVEVEEVQLFQKVGEPPTINVPAASIVYPANDRNSEVRQDESNGVQLRASNTLDLPLTISDDTSDHPFGVPLDDSEQAGLDDFGSLKQPSALKSSFRVGGSKIQTSSVTIMDYDDACDSSSNADSAIDYGDYRSTLRTSSHVAQRITNWLPSYRLSQDFDKQSRRRGSIISEISATRSTVLLILEGSMSWSEACSMFFRGEYFDYFMGVFLMLNAISIGVQVNYMANQTDQNPPLGWRLIDGCFCLVFTVELIIRIILYRAEYLRMPGWQWNLFDLFVVGFSVMDELTKLIFPNDSNVREAIDELFVLKMFRLARVVRLIRMVRLIPELKSMVYLIAASMQAFFWTMLLLMILIYVVSVYYTEMATEMKLKEGLEDLTLEALSENYGSIGAAMFSLFQAITGGDDWRNFVVVFKGENYVLNSLVFCVYIAFATLVMLNLVTGVFVEGAQRIIKEDKEAELVKSVRKLFSNSDRDHSGELSMEEFSTLVEHRTMRESLEAVEMSPEQAKALFVLLDEDNSGELSVEEFVQGCIRMRVPARSIDLNVLKYDFDSITQLWASHFAVLDLNIRQIMDQIDELAQATVSNIEVEHYTV